MDRNKVESNFSLLPEPDSPWLASSGFTSFRGKPAKAAFLRAPDAPDEALDLLWKTPADSDEIYRTTQSRVVHSGDFILKTSFEPMTTDRWDRTMGPAALAINLALSEGLNEDSILESGYRVIAPRYFGALLFPGRRAAKWVMSHEHGEVVVDDNREAVSTRHDRHSVFNSALTSAGINPVHAWYDDWDGNLLVRPKEQEVVALDMLAAVSHGEILGTESAK